MLLFYLRHADPIYQPDDLTKQGRRQADALSKRLALYGLDKIYSSTSTRAVLTAQPTAELVNLDITQLEWCEETQAFYEFCVTDAAGKRCWGFEDKETRMIMASNEMASLGHQWWKHPALANTDFKKGYDRIQEKTYAFLAEQGYIFDPEKGTYRAVRKNNERIALFAHQGFGMAFMSCVLNIPYPMYCTRFDFGHSGMTVLEFSDSPGETMPTVLTMSNDSHLYRDGFPTKYQNRIFLTSLDSV